MLSTLMTMVMELQKAQDRDVFREIPLRYLGYVNELGESFRHMVPVRVVHLSYVISSSYVLSHAISQGLKSNKTNSLTLQQSPAHDYHHPIPTAAHRHTTKSISPTVAVLDTLLWQGLASVVIPGLVINRLCAVSRILLTRRAGRVLSTHARKWIVTGIGISAIPVIIHPIDSAVDKFMDALVRPFCIRFTSSFH